MGLALATGIPYSTWIREDDRTIETAVKLLQERNQE